MVSNRRPVGEVFLSGEAWENPITGQDEIRVADELSSSGSFGRVTAQEQRLANWTSRHTDKQNKRLQGKDSQREAFLAEVFRQLAQVNIIRHRRSLPIRTQLEHNRNRILAAPRTCTGPHLDGDASKTPDVDFGAVRTRMLVHDHFGCHPVDGSSHGGVRRVVVDIVREAGYSKVGDFTDSVRVDQNVIAFQVLGETESVSESFL